MNETLIFIILPLIQIPSNHPLGCHRLGTIHSVPYDVIMWKIRKIII